MCNMHNAAACGNSQSDEWRLDNATRLRVLHSHIIRYCRRNSVLSLSLSPPLFG